LRAFKNRVPKKIFGPKEEVRTMERSVYEEHHDLYSRQHSSDQIADYRMWEK
jgi:hypothetical protein